MLVHLVLPFLILKTFSFNESTHIAQIYIQPLTCAHAHNDYLHPVPLYEALGHGFTSVEADVHLVDGELMVAHKRKYIQKSQTLETLYLSPLQRLIHSNGGTVFRNGMPLTLLIDIKTEAVASYKVLRKVLSRYQNILTIYEAGYIIPGPIKVVISGHRARGQMARQKRRFATMDGRLPDLNYTGPDHFIELISDKWTDIFTWNGEGVFPAEERKKLEGYVSLVHRQGKQLRFWNTPDSPMENETAVWTQLLNAGVDFINTEDLDGLKAFLLNHDEFQNGHLATSNRNHKRIWMNQEILRKIPLDIVPW